MLYFTLPSIQDRFDFTYKIVEKEIASTALSPLVQDVTVHHRNRIKYYNVCYCLYVHDPKRLSPNAFLNAS